ncbi:HK97 gp10 family phage protein [Haloplanus salinus]|jgi:hypothetical protein|uniref:HK97 gp10 family phage protein n=1 Tax=Haloplanus salinus TaxID=1126245 RepID=A0A368NEQ9_9EURY|nr:HK97 gp10 family phage protein [Haloplanus salinus]RCU47931.1 HK97 gp10 family phage protein [Haloplanus salinus]
MGNFDIRIEFSADDVASDIAESIEAGIEDAQREMGKTLPRIAQAKLRSRDAMFNREVLKGFREKKSEGGGIYELRVFNTAEHASYVEHGVRGVWAGTSTKHEYSTKRPPVEELLPWVERKLAGWRLVTSTQTGQSQLVPV